MAALGLRGFGFGLSSRELLPVLPAACHASEDSCHGKCPVRLWMMLCAPQFPILFLPKDALPLLIQPRGPVGPFTPGPGVSAPLVHFLLLSSQRASSCPAPGHSPSDHQTGGESSVVSQSLQTPGCGPSVISALLGVKGARFHPHSFGTSSHISQQHVRLWLSVPSGSIVCSWPVSILLGLGIQEDERKNGWGRSLGQCDNPSPRGSPHRIVRMMLFHGYSQSREQCGGIEGPQPGFVKSSASLVVLQLGLRNAAGHTVGVDFNQGN